MLVLTRRAGQCVVIGDNVTLTILSVKGNQAQIGISAPKTTIVNRQEVKERQDRLGRGAPRSLLLRDRR